MKNTFLLSIFLLIATIAYSQEDNQHWKDAGLVVHQSYSLFGDQVNLRLQPNKDADIIKVLSINTTVELLELTSKVIRISSHDSLWVKIKTTDGDIGYLPATFIATGKIALSEQQLIYKRKNINGMYLIFFRLLNTDGSYDKMGTFDLLNEDFAVSLFDNKGLSHIDHIIQINYLAEACGEEGGVTYLTLNLKNKDLLYLAALSSIGDGGIYHKHEQLIFPADPNGMENTIIYEGEEGEMINEVEELYKTVKFSKPYHWYASGTKHPIRSFNYDDSLREEKR